MPPTSFIPSQPGPSVILENQFSPVKAQWQNPSDILSILMIIGGDIVQRAVAQLAGSGRFSFTPVAFSFGWVAYSLNAVCSAVGDGRLMPAAEGYSVLVNAKNGYTRTVQSWVLARLVRDHRPRHEEEERGLTVSLYRTSCTKPMGVPDRDWVYYSGVGVMVVQAAIAVIPGALHDNWVILLLTLMGLSQVVAAREGKGEVVCLTQGNGSKNVIVIVNEHGRMKFEDLAAGRDVRSRYTVFLTSALAVLWIVHLLIVAGAHSDAWYLLAIGALGMVQNLVAAGARRSPGALGVHLVDERVIYREKVFQALKAAESLERHVGLSLLPVFFPGGLREEEEAWRRETLEDYAETGSALGAVPTVHSHSGADQKEIQADVDVRPVDVEKSS
ncbi:hypothetical protein EW146_g1825 [Bondarzewia mesenterica]|uniref:Uncharacterized protein n=1 Tax=Bondarzewia mesenterica TaxID=1095465 RepID=A0A4S4M429_9AGAM|nr:hypothetical protein EW146_g1825 [Bondarzewia mesenterica]